MLAYQQLDDFDLYSLWEKGEQPQTEVRMHGVDIARKALVHCAEDRFRQLFGVLQLAGEFPHQRLKPFALPAEIAAALRHRVHRRNTAACQRCVKGSRSDRDHPATQQPGLLPERLCIAVKRGLGRAVDAVKGQGIQRRDLACGNDDFAVLLQQGEEDLVEVKLPK